MIEKLDRLQGRNIYENTALAKLNEVIDAVNAIQKEREAEWFEIKEWIGILEAVRESVNVHEKQIDDLQMKVNPEKHDYLHADLCDTDDIAEVKNENLYTKKKLDRAMWWQKEIVNNHRFTPITTAEMALKELNKKTSVWDIQDYLKSNEDLANFLESALEENDYDFLKIAVNDVITALRKKGE